MSDFLSIQGVSFSHTGAIKPLFSNVTVTFAHGWTAITGPNGGGKTTLLKLACGMLKPDSGSVHVPPGFCVYCEQDALLPFDWESLFWSADSRIRKIFSLLRVADDFPLRWETLSGGEKKRLQVGFALCAQPAVLALDEPTNHLDARSMHIIAETLREYDGIGLLVSHSRSLMDSLCPRTLYISPSEQTLYSCPVSEALSRREQEHKSAQNEWQNAQNMVKKAKRQVQSWAEETAKTAARMSKSRLDKKDSDSRGKINLARVTGKDSVAANTKSRINSKLAHNRLLLDSLKKPLQRKSGISLATDRLERDKICALAAGTLYPLLTDATSEETYGLTIPDLLITPASRIALIGENGSGKTLLIRHILLSLGYDDSGDSLVRQNGLVYIPQEISPALSQSYVKTFYKLDDAQKGETLSQIYRLGSEPLSFLQQNGQSTAEVSPGELRKLVIALALQTGASFIILDEPTNHLDLEAVLLLEDALRPVQCALLLCSHDDYFIRSLTTETWKTERTGRHAGKLTALL